jgi:hypothetical protein
MTDDDDPEVRADLELRAETLRERGRVARVPSWSAPVICARWPCRSCGVLVDVTGDAVEAYLRFNEMLKRRNEQTLDTARIVFCDSCRVAWRKRAGERARAAVEKMRELIQRLKRSSKPEQERALILQLEQLGHGDTESLVAAIRDSRKSRKAPGAV